MGSSLSRPCLGRSRGTVCGSLWPGFCAEWQSAQADGISEARRLPDRVGRCTTGSAGRRARLDGVKHGPDQRAAVRGRQNPESTRQASDHGEPGAMQAQRRVALTPEGWTGVSNA